jgi:hypothetical protein
MKRLLIILALCVMAGCTTVGNTASYTAPDGTIKTLEQKVSVPPFGEVKEGLLDFRAEAIGADGANWVVESGTASTGVTTDVNLDVIRALLQILAAP